MPLDTETKTVSASRSGATRCAVLLTAKEGVASTTILQPLTQLKSVVSPSPAGNATPLSMGFSLVSHRMRDSSSA